MKLVDAIIKIARADKHWEEFRQEAVDDFMRSDSVPPVTRSATGAVIITPQVRALFADSDDDIAAATLECCLDASFGEERSRWGARFILRFAEEARYGRCRVSGIVGMNNVEIPARLFGPGRFVDKLVNATREFDLNELTLPDGTVVVAIEVEFPDQVGNAPKQSSTKEKRSPKRRPGRKPKERTRVKEQMLSEIKSQKTTLESLRAMKLVELEIRYDTSDQTADRARDEVIKDLENS